MAEQLHLNEGEPEVGSDMGRFFTDFGGVEQRTELSATTKGLEEDFQKREVLDEEVDGLSERYADFLEKAGLSLGVRKSHYKSKGLEIDERTEHEETIINIEDRKKFIDYLEHFGDQGLDVNKINALNELAGQFSLQAADYYKIGEKDDDFINLAVSFGPMSEQFKEYAELTGDNGLKEYTRLYAGYRDAMSGKYLKEFLVMERLEYDFGVALHSIERDKVDKFHQRYPKIADHKKAWAEISATIEQAAKNKNAHEFLSGGIEFIETGIYTAEDAIMHSGDAKDKQHLAVFNDAREKLEKIREAMTKEDTKVKKSK